MTMFQLFWGQLGEAAGAPQRRTALASGLARIPGTAAKM